MKYLKTIILIGLIASFYFIQISYNGGPSDSLGSGLKKFIKEELFFDVYFGF